MLSKLIAYAPTREQAIRRLRRALDEYFVGGIATNLALFREILDDPDFAAARIHTGYLDRLLSSRVPAVSSNGTGEKIAAIAAALLQTAKNGNGARVNGQGNGAAATPGKWKNVARQEALRD